MYHNKKLMDTTFLASSSSTKEFYFRLNALQQGFTLKRQDFPRKIIYIVEKLYQYFESFFEVLKKDSS